MRSFPLVGEVNPAMLQTACLTLAEYESRGVKQLRIDISSPGGNIEDGLAIATRMKLSPIKITTCGLAEVASSALLIMAAGDIRIASSYCQFLFHEISVEPPYSTVSELKFRVRRYEEDNKRMVAALSEFTKVEPQVWRHLIDLKQDFVFDAKKAVEMGFIQRLLK